MGGRRSRWANLLGALGLLGVVAAVAIGLPAWDRAVPGVQPVAAHERFAVGAGVTVVPPAGAQVDVTATRPGLNQGSALFVLGAVRYALVVSPPDVPGAPDTLAGAEKRLRKKITNNRGYQVAGGTLPMRTAQGVAGLQGSYTAPGRCGWYAVFLAPTGVVEVTVSGADQALRGVLGPIQASVADLRFPAEDK